MEKLCFRYSVSVFTTIIVIFLLPRHTLFATSSSYTRPEKFYVNCGSDSNINYGGRNFVGDMIPGDNSVSFDSKESEASNQSGPGIYGTVRIFRRPSSYKFQLDSVGLHFVRLHVSSRTELLTSRFAVSAISGSTHHFKSFPVQNFNETPRVEEFLLMIDSTKLEIRFVPEPSYVALVNAIEVFSASNDLEITPESDKNLHTIYRLNVGGQKVTPENDTLGRTWSSDDDFLYQREAAREVRTSQKPNYDSGSVTEFTAPDFVYQTAKAINGSSSELSDMLMNITWSFKVKSKTKHFVRAHFCDVSSGSQSSDSDFYLYVNGHVRKDANPSEKIRLVTPFFIDTVDVSDGSGLLNVSVGTKEPRKVAGFLNGLEVMEFLNKSGSDNKSSYKIYIIIGCVAAGLILFLSLLFAVFLKRRRSKKKKKKKPEEEATIWSPVDLYRGGSSDNRLFDSPLRTNRPFDPVHNSPLRSLNLGLKIPFTDIRRATNNFDPQWLIGKGGFGNVYKAIFPDGSRAAIKRGKTGSGQGILEFQTEIQVLSRIRHKHLVSLKGYCDENSEMILVYEYMEKGTLKEHLYGSGLPSLTWKQRLEICIGAARGLHYLHSGSEGIIHRDVKSTNILLDENKVAKVADFGLSKLAARDQDPINISMNIKGTFGYLDPEYLQTHIFTEKSDVYAFGVVLLEVLCARPALAHDLPHEEVNLAEWAMFCLSKGIVDEILDTKLIGQIEASSLRKFMEIVEKCLRDCGEERPSMGDVIWDLEYVLQLHMTPVQREPHEDSTMTMISGIGGGNSLVVPRLMVSDSFSENSFVEKKSSYGDSSETQVFSQLKISEAR
ncbi:receptor-like protein kinase [Hirschfeldia incana]|nr:receptor-like protein kinase [Hirschfeldia incana]